MSRQFTIDDLITVAKRENNNKRSYLYVNPVQGKHIPVSPSLSIDLFSQMAAIVEKQFENERLLVIGFAETATAIGATIACKAGNAVYYMNTTREEVPDAEYLFFTESHSHAVEQRLVKNGLAQILPHIDRIVFAEDEVTTGKTIEKLIRVLQSDFDCGHCRFGIISILNSMPEERMQMFREKQIACAYLYRIPVRYRVDEIENHSYAPLPRRVLFDGREYREIKETDGWNSRIVTSTERIRKQVDLFVENIFSQLDVLKDAGKVLVLGTEEFMFPGMLLGQRIEQEYPEICVRFHATTRSPIEISGDAGYPLHSRSLLYSLYEENRQTYLYNIGACDCVILVTDADPVQKRGMNSLMGAVTEAGNKNIILVRWETGHT